MAEDSTGPKSGSRTCSHKECECLRELPDRQTAVVRAHYFDEQPVPELSERFGRSVEAIYKSLQRTRQSLHDCIERKTSMEAGS